MQLLNLLDYEAPAREQLNMMVYTYYAGGANDELTLRDNREAFERVRLLPHMLRGAVQRDLSADVLGKRWSVPFAVSPMALQKMAHPEGEIGVARACEQVGAPYIVSTMSTISLEDIAASAPSATLWFQLYMFKDQAINRDLIERAQDSGYQALVVTVDTPLLGRREGALRTGFHIPSDLSEANLRRYEKGDIANLREQGMAGQFWRDLLREDGISWSHIEWVQSVCKLPIIIKGILRPDDARTALEMGVASVFVSNHGGRQLDGAIATLDALPAVVDALEGKIPVLLDGGVRRGTDVLKALALGANAVALGRPVLWGLALDGQAGAQRILELLRDELDLAMALCGCAKLSEIQRDLLADAPH